MTQYHDGEGPAAQAADLWEMGQAHPAGLSASRELAMALAYVASEGAGVTVEFEIGEWGSEEERWAA